MKKILSMLLVVVMALGCFAACGASEPAAPAATEAPAPAPVETPVETPAEPEPTPAPAEPVTIRIGGQQGPTSMGMVKMLKDSENGLTANKYEYVLDNADALNTATHKATRNHRVYLC